MCGLRLIVGNVSLKRRELKSEVNKEYWSIIASLPEEVQADIDDRIAPGMIRNPQDLPTSTPVAKQSNAPRDGQGSATGKEAWTFPKDLPGKGRASVEASSPTLSPDAVRQKARRNQDPPER